MGLQRASAWGTTTVMIDPFGRSITYLRVSVTDRCDLRCVYCMAEDMTFLPRADLLSLEELDQLCGVFIRLGTTKIRITGDPEDPDRSPRIDLQGAKDVSSSGVAIELSGQRTDENTLDAPTKVAPVTKKIENAGTKFAYTFPANSLTILRLKAK